MAVPANHEYPTVAGTVVYIVRVVCAVVYWNCIGGAACWPEGWLAVLAVDALAMSRSNCVNTGWLRCVSRASRISLKKRSGFSTRR